jgi:hypothetical protein
MKALSKKRGKGGRPRKQGAERYPGGQIKHDYRKAETEREIMGTVLDMRQRQHGLDEKDAKSALAGFVLGRMRLDKSINEVEFKAGERYAEDMARYYRLTGIAPPSPRAQSLFSIAGHDGDVSEDQARRAREAANKMMALEGVLLRLPDGPRVKTTVFNVCLMDFDNLRDMPLHMFGWLHSGLRALAIHYGLQDERKSANKTT